MSMSAREVVISGIGGHFPRSSNVHDFGRDLLENRSLPTPTNRWRYDKKFDVNAVCGQLPFENFDDTFYGVNKRLALTMDPVSKMGYQRSFEAVIDAGFHPHSMMGAPVGVYTCSCINELEQMATSLRTTNNYYIMGSARCMFANRISFFFGFNGPSCGECGSWSSSHMQLQQAAEDIRSGRCEAAVIVASNLVRLSNTSFLLKKMGFISDDSVTRCFDEDASGSVRSDCCVAFFLQRADRAKRCYAKILASGVEFVGRGSTANFTLPNPRGIASFLSQLYRSHKIDPNLIAYLEADGSAHPIRDECELNAIDAALVKDAGRCEPLRIGSVKSNLGMTDSVSGYAAICKAIVAMETGTIPATLNFRKANPRATGLVQGRLKVVDANTPLDLAEDSVVAVNTMGMSCTVGHTVLRANPRPPPPPMNPEEHLPRLLTVSGRTEEGLKEVVSKIQAAPFDTNYYRLIQEVFSPNIRSYNFRSYIICPSTDPPPVEFVMKRPLWFVYSGMGSQWAGMGAGLMRIPIFAETIERLHKVLEPKGVDLKTIITETGPQAFDNILKSFVGITAIQVALTNVLTAVGLVPDGIIGHSLGEQGCAYADGCLTEEQTVLASWARGYATGQADLIKGSMAAIGLGYKDVLPRLPPSIDVACRNSDTSCTLSGPAEDVHAFVEELTKDGIFARAVNVSDTAYHSRYIQPAAPFLREALAKVITERKLRSAKWVSTSVPAELQDREESNYCSVDYLTNNLLSPVLFEEGLKKIAEQSMVIEIAPHGLLQAILKRSLATSLHIALTRRDHEDPIRLLLGAIGQTSFGAAQPNVSALYPDVEFPVPRGTASLASLVTWQVDRSTYNDTLNELVEYSSQNLELYKGMPSVKVNDTQLLPFSEGLVLMWFELTFKKSLSATAPISFRKVHFNDWRVIPLEGKERLLVSYMNATTQIEIVDESKFVVMTGLVNTFDGDTRDRPIPLAPLSLDDSEAITVSREELYQDLSARGLQYDSKLQAINYIRMTERDWVISITYNEDRSSFLESLVQVYMLRDMDVSGGVRLPKSIRHIEIDVTKIHTDAAVILRLNLATGILSGEGVFVSGFSTVPCPAEFRVDKTAVSPQFVPFGHTTFKTVEEFLRLAVSTGLETGKSGVTLLELANGKQTTLLREALSRSIHIATGIQPRVATLPVSSGTTKLDAAEPVSFLVSGPSTLPEARRLLSAGSASLLLALCGERVAERGGSGLAVLAQQRLGGDWISLLGRASPLRPGDARVVELGPASPSPPAVVPRTTETVLVWRGIAAADVQAAVEEVDSRRYTSRVRLVFVLCGAAPPFSLTEALFADQLALGARVNVLAEDGSWGCWRTLPIPKPLSAALSASTLGDVQLELLGANPLDRGSLSGHLDFVGVAAGRRVMGVAQWRADYCRPEPDPLLRWAVPQGWPDKDAATVPFVYSMVYYALTVKSQARRGESILIQDGTSPLGQAAIRVATQLGCSPIFVTVRDARLRRSLREIFPQLEPSHVLLLCDGSNRAGLFEFPLRTLTRGKGVRLIFNSLPDSDLQASVRCLGDCGRLLHFDREDALAARSIGMWVFRYCAFIHGFSGNVLFTITERDRIAVAECVSEGLRAGVVQPLVGAEVFNGIFDESMIGSSLLSGVSDYSNSKKAIVEVKRVSVSKNREWEPKKCYIVVGKHTSDVLLVAGRLSLLGARLILAAVGPSPSLGLIQQRQRALRRQHGTVLSVKEVPVWDAEAAAALVRDADSLAPVHAGVVIARDAVDLSACSLLGLSLSGPLVLLSDAGEADPSVPLAALASQRGASGRSTVCMAAPLNEAVDHLAGLLGGAAPPVTVLRSARGLQGTEENYSAVLPSSSPALVKLSRAAWRCRDGPCFTELPSLAPPSRFPSENLPLFVLPPLGVMDPPARDQVAGLAARLLSPVLVVEAAVRGSVRDAAAVVVKAIVLRQPFGPYNVLGWSLGAVLALEVHRQLESLSKRGALFLVQGDVAAVRRWAEACPPLERVVQNDMEAEALHGAEVVVSLLDAITKHESDIKSPFEGGVHVVRTSVDYQQSLEENESRVDVRTLPDLNLGTAQLAELINDNIAHSHFADNNDLRLSIFT